MKQIINSCILKCLVEMILFIEFSEEDIVDPDAGVQALEQLAAGLSELEVEDSKELNDNFIKIANEYDGEKKEFLIGLGSDLGLV